MARPSDHYEFIERCIREFIPEKQASILVCGSARSERDILSGIGYENVVFTGMDLREEVTNGQTPKFENAEALSFKDESFDYALIKDTVHHTSLPNKVLTELYRVSRKGFLVIEARDSILIRLASKLGLTEQYEVAGNFKGHGVNGTDVPNFICDYQRNSATFVWFSYSINKIHIFNRIYSGILPPFVKSEASLVFIIFDLLDSDW
jgi:SAM-dependent methyltransferase